MTIRFQICNVVHNFIIEFMNYIDNYDSDFFTGKTKGDPVVHNFNDKIMNYIAYLNPNCHLHI